MVRLHLQWHLPHFMYNLKKSKHILLKWTISDLCPPSISYIVQHIASNLSFIMCNAHVLKANLFPHTNWDLKLPCPIVLIGRAFIKGQTYMYVQYMQRYWSCPQSDHVNGKVTLTLSMMCSITIVKFLVGKNR